MSKFPYVPDGDRSLLTRQTDHTVLDATGGRIRGSPETPSSVLLELDIHTSQGPKVAYALTLRVAMDLSRLLRFAMKHQLGRDEIDHVETKVRSVGDNHARVLVDLTVDCAQSLADNQYFDERIVEGVPAELCHLRVNKGRLIPELILGNSPISC